MRTAGLYGIHGSASKGGNFVQRMVAAGRASRAQLKMVSDQRLQPTFTADLAAATDRGGRGRRERRRST